MKTEISLDTFEKLKTVIIEIEKELELYPKNSCENSNSYILNSYMSQEQIINRIRSMRKDAEKSNRDHLPGIEMLRSWLRGLHIDVIIGRDAVQDLSQDTIAKLLVEFPRGH